MKTKKSDLVDRLVNHLSVIYPDTDALPLAQQLITEMGLDKKCKKPRSYKNHWNQQDIIAITYGDSIVREGENPLVTLHGFFQQNFADIINAIHILPFYPYSSDDGFAVINYKQVNDKLGNWPDVEDIARDFKLMADLVVNHVSSRSEWFEQFRKNHKPEKDFFICEDPSTDLSEVVRPRTNPLLRPVETLEGEKHVWCTFSYDQVDLNFKNPQVLLEMVSIVNYYLERGVQIFRLDAVAFLWKEIGTSCLNLPQTHEIIRLLRTLIEYKNPKSIIITETNIPNRENLAYFGNANEAHIIYNFALPPLLLHALLTGQNFHLNNWLMSMPPAQDGTTYLNFIASHDGIGLRPVEGILSDEETEEITDVMQQFGGRISWRKLADGGVKPYEINISLIDALSGTLKGPDDFQVPRFICAHIIMLGLEGIPAVYIHSLLATPNDLYKMEQSGSNRAINRHVWQCQDLNQALTDTSSIHSKVLQQLKNIISIRTQQDAFHPNATQYTLHLGEGIFAFWRQSRKRNQSIFCIHNISDETQSVPLRGVNLVHTQQWQDLFTGTEYNDLTDTLELQPYQSLWLTNLKG